LGTIMQKVICLVLCAVSLMLAACEENEPTLEETFTIYDLAFQLPADWRLERNMQVMGGFGFAAPDYEGRTYLQLHEGSGFVVLGDWEPSADAAGLLAESF